MISNSRDALRMIASAIQAPDNTLSVGLLYKSAYRIENQRLPLLLIRMGRWATDMSYAENLWLYFLLLFGIIIVPGMDMLFVLANALTGGRGAGLAATAGIMLGGA